MSAGQASRGSADDTSIREMIRDWRIHLGQKSTNTIKIYTRAAERLASYLENGRYPQNVHNGAALPTHVAGVGSLELILFFDSLTTGDGRLAEASRSQIYRALQQFFAFLVNEGEIQTSPMLRVHPPSQKPMPVPVIDIEDLRKLVATCTTNTFQDRRDLAILRLLIDTGMRVGELAGMTIDAVELERALITVQSRSGVRQLLLEPKTVEALRRYLRARRRHRHADLPELWLSMKGHRKHAITHWGIRQIVDRRVQQAGLTGRIYPTKFRLTYAHRWLANGGQAHDLMLNAGWKSPSVVARCTAASAADRARQAAARAGLADQI